MILHAALEILPVLPKSNGERGIEIIVQPPIHLVAVAPVLFGTQGSKLVGVVAQALCVEDQFVEVLALAIAGIHGE